MTVTAQAPAEQYPRQKRAPHPLCAKVRDLRRAAGYSLLDFENKHGIPSVVIGAYERGDRIPTIIKLDTILNVFGYRLAAVPVEDNDQPVVRSNADIVTLLRAIADQVEVTAA